MSYKSDYIRVPITMPAEMIEYLDGLSLKAKMSGGRKLANTEIVRAAVRFMMESGVDVGGCKNEEDVLTSLHTAAMNCDIHDNQQ